MTSQQVVEPPAVQSLQQVLDRIRNAGEGETVSVDDVLQSIGPRSFGALLLAPAIIIITPLSGIPGLPSIGAAIIALIAAQMLLGRKHFWLPRFLRCRSVPRERLDKAVAWLVPAARMIDRLVGPRLSFLTEGPFAYLIGLLCLLLALLMPPLEIVPLSNSLTATAIALFGLALVARDGLLAILATLFMAGAIYAGFAFIT